ncbi:uncharacterized mitochondrial protein-like protein, partial [Tanacetum coccineum]
DAETQGRYNHDAEVITASAPITTADVSVSTVEPSTPPTTTTLIEDEDFTIAQTLMEENESEISKKKSKESSIQDQIVFDEEIARRLEAEMQVEVWTLVDLPYGKRAIGTKWVYMNKKDERAIRLFLAYAPFKEFVVYLMDVKIAFLYGKIEKEVYVCQPPVFEDPEFPDRVYKKDDGIFISQDKYVDEILKKFRFSTMNTASTPMETSKPLLKDTEAKDVDVHLYRSMIRSLMYLTASRPDIMFVVCACARFQVIPKVSQLHAVKRIFRYLKGQPKLGLWYPKDSPFDLEAYTDSDYASASLDMKSTIGDETVIKEWEDIMERAATTTSSLEVEQDSGSGPKCQDTILRGAEAQIRFEAASKQFNDPPLSRDNTLRSGEDNMKLMELIELCTKLRKQRKDSGPTEPITTEATNEEHVSTPSYDPSQNDEDRMQLNELMNLCTKLSDRVLALDNENTSQAAEIATLKERIKKLEQKRRSRIYKSERLYKVGSLRRVESSKESSGAQEDASKQGRKIIDLDTNAEVTLIDETQERNNEDLMFDTGVLDGDEVFEEPMVNAATTTSSIPVSADDPVTTASVEVIDELTLAQTLIEIKTTKP